MGFRFLELPPELRNRIYQECLTDDNGIFFSSNDNPRRRLIRCRLADCRPNWASEVWRESLKLQKGALPSGRYEPLKSLLPHLLLVCRQIYDEATPVLYGQPLYFENSYALESLLIKCSPRCAVMLKDLTLLAWDRTRCSGPISTTCMSKLASYGGLNLTRLRFDCSFGGPYLCISTPRWSAETIYSTCGSWLRAVGAHRGDPFAAIRILSINNENFKEHVDYQRYVVLNDAAAAERLLMEAKGRFEDELKNMLGKTTAST